MITVKMGDLTTFRLEIIVQSEADAAFAATARKHLGRIGDRRLLTCHASIIPSAAANYDRITLGRSGALREHHRPMPRNLGLEVA